MVIRCVMCTEGVHLGCTHVAAYTLQGLPIVCSCLCIIEVRL